MSFLEIIALIKGVLEFPDAVLKLIKALQSTPSEKHDAMMAASQKEWDSFKETGRPTWD